MHFCLPQSSGSPKLHRTIALVQDVAEPSTSRAVLPMRQEGQRIGELKGGRDGEGDAVLSPTRQEDGSV